MMSTVLVMRTMKMAFATEQIIVIQISGIGKSPLVRMIHVVNVRGLCRKIYKAFYDDVTIIILT